MTTNPVVNVVCQPTFIQPDGIIISEYWIAVRASGQVYHCLGNPQYTPWQLAVNVIPE